MENKEDMHDSDVNVSGYEIQVNYLNVYASFLICRCDHAFK